MMDPTRWLALCSFACVGGAVVMAPAAPDEPRVFEHDDGYEVAVIAYEAASEIDYDEGEAEHSVEFTCRVLAPERLDAVCLLEELEVTLAEDDDGDDIYLPPRRRRGQREDFKYAAFLQGQNIAEIELKTAELSRPAYTIQRMELVSEAVLAEERGEFDLPAIVDDDDTETPYDTTVRLSEMKIGRDHKAEIVIEFQRENELGSPLPEAIYALDEDGNVLGGGRWTEATNLFGEEGTFEAEFFVSDDADVTTLRLVFLTEYEVVPLTFEVTRVFQD